MSRSQGLLVWKKDKQQKQQISGGGYTVKKTRKTQHKQISGYEGLYDIYTDGAVWSYGSNRFLKVRRDAHGYQVYTLCTRGKVRVVKAHRLVYAAFCGAIPTALQINHKDGDKLNNHFSNLELLTPIENTRHAWRTGLAIRRTGTAMGTSKLKEDDIPRIRAMKDSGMASPKIAQIFGVHDSTIRKILTRATWSGV